ncbi:acyl-CoA thioesterase [Alicyclobacillaceae bacterium I2511]|nr:acyl-CoA thioesterase [Alicyclobacillaceae bacterium I2511]
MWIHDIVVRFGECDSLGHVNNAVYFTYLEEARMELFRVFNPTLDLEKWNLIVASARCDFLTQVKYAEKIQVLTWIGSLGTSSFRVEQAVHNAAGQWTARGQAIMLTYDYQHQQTQPLWTQVRSALMAHQGPPAGVPALRE